MDNDAERVRAYLAGWDDAMKCWRETMSWVPDDQLVAVVRLQAEREQK